MKTGLKVKTFSEYKIQIKFSTNLISGAGGPGEIVH
jgi:hypothetical protein